MSDGGMTIFAGVDCAAGGDAFDRGSRLRGVVAACARE